MLPLINRELSWLEFNQRVLNEAMRADLRLLERLKFLAISASNLDEFFQVRVGGLMLRKLSGRSAPDSSGLSPDKCLAAIRRRVRAMNSEQYRLLANTLLPALAQAGIRLLGMADLPPAQAALAAEYFDTEVLAQLTPLAIDLDGLDGPPVAIPGLCLTVICRLLDPDTQTVRHAVIPIPETVNRRVPVKLEGSPHAFVLAEDLVATHAGRLFPGETVTATAVFRVTRNGDIAVREDDAIDLADEMEDVLTARRSADTVRLELRSNTPQDLAQLVQSVTRASPDELFRCPGPPGLAGFMDLAFLPGFDHLRNPEWLPQQPPAIIPGSGMFETIAAGDLLLHHPYESFDPVLRLLDEAAADPGVIAIKQVLYRTARQSRIVDSLIKAAENGKQVTVLVELKARFDEALNLDRADELRRAGAQIVYGVKNLKTHAKICLIIRREDGYLRRYVHLGTGNYNESTAKLYTDISYLTCKPDFGHDASLLFNAVTGRSKLLRFKRLVPAPTAMKRLLLDLIAGEAGRARDGLPAHITAKINSLQDPEIIRALYQASRAGVRIRLNVRGICCLKPGHPKHSQNIEVVSIIDRFLEHARIFHFHHGGDPQVFISSADWMTRNLDRRIELMVPIEDAALKRRLIRVLEAFFNDNTQAYRILPNGSSQRVVRAKGRKTFRVQEHFYRQARSTAKAREHERSMTFEPHLPPP